MPRVAVEGERGGRLEVAREIGGDATRSVEMTGRWQARWQGECWREMTGGDLREIVGDDGEISGRSWEMTVRSQGDRGS